MQGSTGHSWSCDLSISKKDFAILSQWQFREALSSNAACPQSANSYSPPKNLHIISNSRLTTNKELSNSGITTVGDINPKLIENLKQALLGIQQQQIQQTKLKWNSDYKAVVSDFETISSRSQGYTVEPRYKNSLHKNTLLIRIDSWVPFF